MALSNLAGWNGNQPASACGAGDKQSFLSMGCPAVASGVHGNFYDVDQQCWREL